MGWTRDALLLVFEGQQQNPRAIGNNAQQMVDISKSHVGRQRHQRAAIKKTPHIHHKTRSQIEQVALVDSQTVGLMTDEAVDDVLFGADSILSEERLHRDLRKLDTHHRMAGMFEPLHVQRFAA